MKEKSLIGIENDHARALILGSLVISVLCLAFVARHRLGVFDPFSVPIFWHLLITHDFWAALLILGLLAVACLARDARPAEFVVRSLSRHPYIVSSAAFVAFSIGAVLVYRDYPLSMDEYSSRFQSEVFAAGQLTAAFPPEFLDWLVPRPFQSKFLIAFRPSGQVVSYFMPGFSLLLTPFTYLGVPWACNPALGALSVLAIHRLACELAGTEEAGGWAMLFALASPAFSINAMSYYSMSANLLFASCFALLLLTPTPRRAFLAGLIGGFAVAMHSPPAHVLFAAPWVIWLLLRREFLCVGALALGYSPFVLGLGAGWLWMLGDLRGGAAHHTAAGGVAKGGSYIFGWLAAIGKLMAPPDLNTLNIRAAGLVKLWLWAVPGLPLLAWLGFRTGMMDTRYRLLLASAATTFFGYFLIPFDQGHGWGYRYFHTAWSVLPVLAAVAMVRRSVWPQVQARLVAQAGALAFAGLLLLTSLRIFQVDGFIDRHLAQVQLPDAQTAQVAFIDTDQGYYTIDMVQNHHRMKGGSLVMVSHGAEQNALMARKLSPSARLISAGTWGELWSLE